MGYTVEIENPGHRVNRVVTPVAEDVLEPPGAPRPLEAAGGPGRRDPAGEVLDSLRVGGVVGDPGPRGVEADARAPAADIQGRGGGDQLMAVPPLLGGDEEGEHPVGEVVGPGGAGGPEGRDDP